MGELLNVLEEVVVQVLLQLRLIPEPLVQEVTLILPPDGLKWLSGVLCGQEAQPHVQCLP